MRAYPLVKAALELAWQLDAEISISPTPRSMKNLFPDPRPSHPFSFFLSLYLLYSFFQTRFIYISPKN